MNNEFGETSGASAQRGRPAVLAFERQPKESAKAYEAFRIYLDLGLHRTLVAVAKKLGQSKCMPERWSRRYGWQARVRAWDAHFADLERRTIEQMAVEQAVEWWKLQEPTRRQAWQEAEHAIAMVKQAREQWQKSGRTPGFEGIARLLELAFKLKQFADGMPAEIKEVHSHVTGKVSVEWEAALQKAYGVKENAETLKGEMLQSEVVYVEAEPAVEVKP